ncbi:Hypothetical predicted protein [Lecanosticta acicola]|uniref:Helix-turn-helix domain-containing protein n=1 Tax=Lecanosticta acicola TaxID=111012 RepID=A0AAI9ED96_9PEZI|nr:Hypothetical predicted protein [Lecanosticta acicola]
MGSSASKASRAAGSAARKYPARPSPSTTTQPQPQAAAPSPSSTSNALPQAPPAPSGQPGPTVKPRPQASGDRSEAINLDASDPDFAQSLRSIGPVQPNPTLSPTSAFSPGQNIRPQAPNPRSNPALAVLEARSKLQDGADREFLEAGRRGHQGREFLDVYTIRQILTLRDEQRRKTDDIEKALGLKRGVVDRLGASGVVELAQETGRAQRDINMV